MNNEINARFASLFPHERRALLDALRRDARALRAKASTDAENASYHLFNHRVIVRLLDVLAPPASGTTRFD